MQLFGTSNLDIETDVKAIKVGIKLIIDLATVHDISEHPSK